ncbi:putative efflux transporter, RND family, MFP subunit [Megalodesulfovibrio gigas DSM 1382 = ATCC 19364]|uniref:Putative efflux transporter, RND family, MFP subunit n=1 Tax=Megalodesulfovibrio gigas (strain ATCC 19364 / DSM 1382 / NCIMB 9332 / VKM B-1759) TaxID=1121448 RepID=T2G6D1_MEGG1|nr:putative efflux transporter, RND family, MFP subunit [Megalodesulfovibrio gigas DSM 1382 = ATCC 19364]
MTLGICFSHARHSLLQASCIVPHSSYAKVAFIMRCPNLFRIPRIPYFVFLHCACLACLALTAAWALAQPPGAPPAKVVTEKAVAGRINPTQTFIGTVYFPEVAKVAAEVSGRVETLDIETGSRVKQGQRLVALSTDIAAKELESSRASHQRLLSQLEIARIELGRMEQLIKTRTVAMQEYDQARFLVQRLEREAESLEASADLLQIKLQKAQPTAPFDGVVLERHAGRGEWLSPGTAIATIARDDYVEVLVELPARMLAFVPMGGELRMTAGGRERAGTVIAIIPAGNVATRTFPLKLHVADVGGPPMPLVQGMEALVDVPSGDQVDAVLVPRDAVILTQGRHVLWVNAQGAAAPVPVDVLAYKGRQAAVRALENGGVLHDGVDVVIKGNERLRPGQPLDIVPASAPQ